MYVHTGSEVIYLGGKQTLMSVNICQFVLNSHTNKTSAWSPQALVLSWAQ